jgi:hypothetical protein
MFIYLFIYLFNKHVPNHQGYVQKAFEPNTRTTTKARMKVFFWNYPIYQVPAALDESGYKTNIGT